MPHVLDQVTLMMTANSALLTDTYTSLLCARHGAAKRGR
jgi:hypothetical protein